MRQNKDFSECTDDDLVTREDIAAYLNVNMTTLVGWLNDGYRNVIQPVEGNGGRGGKYKYLFKDAKYLEEFISENKPKWGQHKKKSKAHEEVPQEMKYSPELISAFKLARDQIVAQCDALEKLKNETRGQINSLNNKINEIDETIKHKQEALVELENLITDVRNQPL